MPTSKGEDELEAGESKDKSSRVHKPKRGALDWIVGGIAHDIKNFIASVSNYSDLILKDLDRHDSRRADLLEIKKSASRAAALASYLIAFSRKEPVRVSLINLNSIVRDMEKMLRHALGKDIALKMTLRSDIGRVIAGPGQIEQVIMNLVLNARKAMPRGGALRVETADLKLGPDSVSPYLPAFPGEYVMLSITDSGTGMSEEFLSHLFKPFYKTKKHRPRTGLGLATVYEIVKQNSGTLFVQSAPRHGSTFRICFPKAIKRHSK